MVFAPFTGVDNHKKCITFAAGLLLKEDIESYIWLFENFKKAMGAEPKIIVTDQDPAMRVAIPTVFKQARHRFCMWHIMCKVGEKVGSTLSNNENFRNKLNSIVWNSYIEPTDFEREWKLVMEEFQLVNNNWFIRMFDLRRFWIPAYFKDVLMGGLLRTTSRSEGENSLFGAFTTPQSSLVEFFMHFERALDSQRYKHAKLNSDSEGYIPDLKTPLTLEKHASSLYTISVFYDVQTEICAACFNCRVLNVREDSGILYYDISDGGKRNYSVVHNVLKKEALCTCKMFERLGLLCRHIFLVFKDLNFDDIPSRYVVNRWTKDASLKPTFHIDGVMFDQCGSKDEKRVLLNQLWADVNCCISLADSNMDKLIDFSKVIKEQKMLLMQGQADLSAEHTKKTIIESFCGSSQPDEISILPPKQAKNKGSGKRIKGCKELAVDTNKKQKRLCRNCNVKAHHDSRNCPVGRDD